MVKFSGWLILLVAFFACSKEDMTFQIGSNFVDVKTNIRYMDTLTVSSYTVVLDSLQTSGLDEPVMLVGRFYDPEFGFNAARTYFRLNPPGKVTVPSDAVFDSLQLIMVYNGYAVGDSNVTFTVTAHRLTEPLRKKTEEYFYNNTITAFDPLELGTSSVIISNNTNDTIKMHLDDTLGTELFGLIMDDSPIMETDELFQLYFKGLALDYDDANETLIGFKFPTEAEAGGSKAYYPTMRLYYHYFDFETVNKYIDFKVGFSNVEYQYNQLMLNDPIVNFPEKQRDKLPAASTGNATYVQAGTGIVTRLEIPFLKNLLALHENIMIMKAELQLEPLRDSYNEFPLPTRVRVYASDNLNRFMSSFIANADLTIDEIFQEETWYTIDVTDFIKVKLFAPTDDVPSLMLTIAPDELYKSFDRIVLGAQGNLDKQVKLKLYYIIYE